jgi:outer membrane protein
MLKNSLITLAFIFSIIAIGLNLFNTSSSNTVFVDTGKVYAEFKLSKELNKDLESILKLKKRSIDSLYQDLSSLTQRIKYKKIPEKEEMILASRMEQQYLYRQNQFEKESQELTVSYNDKIWNQINQYMEEYGQEKNYNFILGATGEGNIMFGNKKVDVTNSVIEYINKKYASN